MAEATALQQRVRALLEERNAILLVHFYQTSDIQEVADHLGDSLALALKASEVETDVIVFAGVDFMAETAKLTNPTRVVLHPNPMARCPMAGMVDPVGLRMLKAENPGVPVVTYVNTTADVKAESDICCTSANAVGIVESLGVDRIIFVPDTNLGLYVQRCLPDIEVIPWPGYCYVHDSIQSADILRMKETYPDAEVLVHPECTPEVIDIADHVASTSGIVRRVRGSGAKQFIIGTEEGLIHHLRRIRPDAEYIQSPPSICKNMKRITIHDIIKSLMALEPRVELEPGLIERARLPVDRMLTIG